MKKLIAVAVVLALVAGVAFAQTANGISVNAWGRAAFSPLTFVGPEQANGEAIDKDDKGETYAGSGVTWGGPSPRVDFRVNGSSDFVGFNTHMTAEDGVGIGDFASIWVKPFGNDFLKITVGRFLEDTLRGKIGNLDGGFSNFVGCGIIEEDGIFGRFGTHGNSVGNNGSNNAFLLSSAPVDGLFIGFMVPGSLWNDDGSWSNTGPGTGTILANAYRNMQIGAGYNIANIGHIRAQYIGGWAGSVDKTDEDSSKYWNDGDTGKLASIEFAFALTAVEGLLVDLGAHIGLPLEVKDAAGSKFYSKGTNIGLGATFNSGAFGVGARVDIAGLGAYAGGRGKDDKRESGATTVIRVVPTFGVGDATIGLDVAFALGGKSKDSDGKDVDKSDTSQLGFGAFVKKGVGPGHIMAGLSYTLPQNNADGKANGSGVFQIPIILEYYFF